MQKVAGFLSKIMFESVSISISEIVNAHCLIISLFTSNIISSPVKARLCQRSRLFHVSCLVMNMLILWSVPNSQADLDVKVEATLRFLRQKQR